ncbi:MAG: cytochrome c family protein, partial [Holophagales bacterium]|nr:cytochrome c family protein [Holophagales bacterium]
MHPVARPALPAGSVSTGSRSALVAALFSLFAATDAGWGQAGAPALAGLDPEKVTTAEACGECHVSAYDVWKKTTHATGFKSLHRLDSAAEIADRMGVKLMKRDSVCLDCHYTPTRQRGQERAVSGVSCESCHGAGRDYIDVHNDYGGKGIDHRTETPEHRALRLERSLEGGMRPPSDLYAVAANCYGCHTVPNEKLVNVGKHSIGSTEFDLVERLTGEIRHNFLDSFLDGDGTVNAERPPEHQRRLYVVGQALAAEHSLRGLAAATENGVYLKAMQRRLRAAVSQLRNIARAADLPEVSGMVAAIREAPARLGQARAQNAAADRVAALARVFLDGHDGTRLAALDPLVAGEGLPFDDEVLLADDGAVGGGEGSGQPAGGTVDSSAVAGGAV